MRNQIKLVIVAAIISNHSGVEMMLMPEGDDAEDDDQER